MRTKRKRKKKTVKGALLKGVLENVPASAFEVITKSGVNPAKILIRMDENGHIVDLWGPATEMVGKYVRQIMKQILADMAQP